MKWKAWFVEDPEHGSIELEATDKSAALAEAFRLLDVRDEDGDLVAIAPEGEDGVPPAMLDVDAMQAAIAPHTKALVATLEGFGFGTNPRLGSVTHEEGDLAFIFIAFDREVAESLRDFIEMGCEP